MGVRQTGQHANGGLYDVVQCHHLARLTDAGLEDAHLRLLIEQPHAEGHTYLRVIRAGRTYNFLRGQQQLVEPLLHHRLAVGARYAHDRDAELVTMTFGQSLQGSQRRRHLQVVGIVMYGLRHLLNDKCPHTTLVQLFYITMTVVTLRAQRKEQRLFRETQ